MLKPVKDLTGGVLVVHEMMAVLFVTITEAYLKDVLIYAVGIDPTLMRDTNQTVSYTDALNTKSLEHLPLAFRTKWVRKFTDYGGPTRWIKDLQGMGARGYRAETASQMETLWGFDISLFIPQVWLTESSFAAIQSSDLNSESVSLLTANI